MTEISDQRTNIDNYTVQGVLEFIKLNCGNYQQDKIDWENEKRILMKRLRNSEQEKTLYKKFLDSILLVCKTTDGLINSTQSVSISESTSFCTLPDPLLKFESSDSYKLIEIRKIISKYQEFTSAFPSFQTSSNEHDNSTLLLPSQSSEKFNLNTIHPTLGSDSISMTKSFSGYNTLSLPLKRTPLPVSSSTPSSQITDSSTLLQFPRQSQRIEDLEEISNALNSAIQSNELSESMTNTEKKNSITKSTNSISFDSISKSPSNSVLKESTLNSSDQTNQSSTYSINVSHLPQENEQNKETSTSIPTNDVILESSLTTLSHSSNQIHQDMSIFRQSVSEKDLDSFYDHFDENTIDISEPIDTIDITQNSEMNNKQSMNTTESILTQTTLIDPHITENNINMTQDMLLLNKNQNQNSIQLNSSMKKQESYDFVEEDSKNEDIESNDKNINRETIIYTPDPRLSFMNTRLSFMTNQTEERTQLGNTLLNQNQNFKDSVENTISGSTMLLSPVMDEMDTSNENDELINMSQQNSSVNQNNDNLIMNQTPISNTSNVSLSVDESLNEDSSHTNTLIQNEQISSTKDLVVQQDTLPLEDIQDHENDRYSILSSELNVSALPGEIRLPINVSKIRRDSFPLFQDMNNDNSLTFHHISSTSSIRHHISPIRTISTHHTLPLLLSGSEEGIVHLWNIKQITNTLKPCRTFGSHIGPVLTSTFVPSINVAVTAGVDGYLCIWDIPSFDKIDMKPSSSSALDLLKSRVEAHSDIIWSIANHPSHSLLVSSSSDNTVKLWNLNGLSNTNLLNSTLLNYVPESLCLPSTITPYTPTDVVFSYQYNKQIGIGLTTGDFSLVDVDTNTLQHIYHPYVAYDSIFKVTSHPEYPLFIAGTKSGSIFMFDPRDSYPVTAFKAHNDSISSCLVPDGFNSIVTSSYDNTIRVWDIKQRTCRQEIRQPHESVFDESITDLAYCSTNGVLISSSVDQTLVFYYIN